MTLMLLVLALLAVPLPAGVADPRYSEDQIKPERAPPRAWSFF